MRSFTIVPLASTVARFEVTGMGESEILIAGGRAGFTDAEVYENNTYMFSIRLERGVWPNRNAPRPNDAGRISNSLG